MRESAALIRSRGRRPGHPAAAPLGPALAGAAVVGLAVLGPVALGPVGPGPVAPTGLVGPPPGAPAYREASLAAADPRLDAADVYAFVSPEDQDTVTLIADWQPFEIPGGGGPDFYSFLPGAHYDINVDSDGDARPDVTYRWVFTDVDKRGGTTFRYDSGPVDDLDDPDLLFKQSYTLTQIRDGRSTTLVGHGVAAPSDTGAASMPDYAGLRRQAIMPIKGGGRAFAGQADDPAFLDLRLFDRFYGGDLSERGRDGLAGYNVQTIALQVPKSDVAMGGDPGRNPVIGVWSSAGRPSQPPAPGQTAPSGGMVQVSRMGNPLINQIISTADMKDAFDGSPPDQDAQNQALLGRITDPEVPRLLESSYGIPAPAAPRNDLAEIFLTGLAKEAPTLDGTVAPIPTDLNGQVLNRDMESAAVVPAEELRLNLGVPVTAQPRRLGVLAGDDQGFPNGRRLTDDVVDIELQELEGAAQTGTRVSRLAAGDKVNANDLPFGDQFPYVALPHDRPADPSGGGVTS
ncbi:DUF4331 domain-containing protein [Rugosimonospora acidiphila]|uniref:DUF4331 domain-containing protein n=1 Tax=Rugosimonospora acidiphila TaxID=556531 RepID=A0ABP9SJ53_9ACTN